jgi:hypothetical protein
MKRDYVRVNALPNSVSPIRITASLLSPIPFASRRAGEEVSGDLRGLFQHEHKGYKVLPLMCEGVSLFASQE